MKYQLVFSTDDRYPINGQDSSVRRVVTRWLWDRLATEAFIGRAAAPDRRRFLVVRVLRVGTLGFEVTAP